LIRKFAGAAGNRQFRFPSPDLCSLMTLNLLQIILSRCLSCVFILGLLTVGAAAQAAATKADLGSATAKHGFQNETEIAGKFNNWKTDPDAQEWLRAMGYSPADVLSVAAAKPHGEKADVELRIKTKRGETTEGISIKLVSNPTGFNQVDKRWLSHYQKMWKMPPDVVESLKLFVGEAAPNGKTRQSERMYLNELDTAARQKVVDFFTAHKAEIVSDMLKGDGIYAAGWLMVALKSGVTPKWTVRKMDDAIRFFGDGDVKITRGGNLKIGRITMQRKGGDAGRETAKMLQFKINPAELFDAK
jgi:hypothetical protein